MCEARKVSWLEWMRGDLEAMPAAAVDATGGAQQVREGRRTHGTARRGAAQARAFLAPRASLPPSPAIRH